MKSNNIKNANNQYINIFCDWLHNKGLTKKTIDNHIFNVKLYINDYLCDYFEMDVTMGCYEIDNFLGDWFIRKTMWSSCAYIKANAASFKKFYACMLENNVVTKEDYNKLCEIIKDCMPDWLDKMKSYEDMIDSEFFDF